MNGVLKEVWPTIDRKLFVAIIDLMEDAMLEASPGIIVRDLPSPLLSHPTQPFFPLHSQTSCRITSLSPGLHPVSVLGLRILPSSRTTPFQHYHKSPAGRKADAEREKDDVKITSAYADPSIPEPSPWAADPNDQGEAKKSANMSDSSTGGGGGGGVGGRNGDETGSGFVGPQPKAADGGEKQHEKNSDEQGAIPGSFVELEIEFGYRRAVKLEGQGEGGRGHGFGGKAEENNDEGEVRAESTKKDGEKVKQVSPEEATENINFVAYMSIGAVRTLLSTLSAPFPTPLSPHSSTDENVSSSRSPRSSPSRSRSSSPSPTFAEPLTSACSSSPSRRLSRASRSGSGRCPRSESQLMFVFHSFSSRC